MRPEILAPAGSVESFDAALAAGCDAIYFGLPQFGARAFAQNFSFEQAKECIYKAHRNGVKIYITMNTLLYEDEIEQAYQCALRVHEMGVDALIIQDVGLIHLLHERLPNLELHASTQLSVTTPEEIYALQKLGVTRVVLARECTLEQIKACVATDVEIEVFIQGALCICYSGQCTFSSFRYGRSGNRGMCAQPCRMPYTLYKDGHRVSDTKYFLSPKDLSVIDDVDVLANIGVASLKIEGRMKSKDYVYESVRQVKKVLDGKKRSKQDEDRLKVAFNRGYTKGYAFNEYGTTLMSLSAPNHQGIEIGEVLSLHKNRAKIKLSSALFQHDGLRFVKKDKDPIGCRVNFLYDDNKRLTSHIDKGICYVDVPKGVAEGAIVLKTVDMELSKDVDESIKHMTLPQHPCSISISCTGVGIPLTCTIYDEKHSLTMTSDCLALASQKRPLDEETLIKQFSKTKDTSIIITSFDIQIADGLFFTIKDLNALRRNIVEAFEKEIASLGPVVEKEYDVSLHEWSCENEIRASIMQDPFRHSNVTNSYAIAACRIMGMDKIVVSDECTFEQIKQMIDGFSARYGFLAPVFVTLVQPRRLMIMNHCPINTEMKDGKRKACHLCHSHVFELAGKDGQRVRCIGDSQCHMRLYETEITDRSNQQHEYEEIGIHHFRYVWLENN